MDAPKFEFQPKNTTFFNYSEIVQYINWANLYGKNNWLQDLQLLVSKLEEHIAEVQKLEEEGPRKYQVWFYTDSLRQKPRQSADGDASGTYTLKEAAELAKRKNIQTQDLKAVTYTYFVKEIN